MPTYDYGCEACGAEWELEQRITANPIKKCPTCGAKKARRLITKSNFILKGDGWYADLYHKPQKTPKKAEASSDGGSSSDSTASASTDKADAADKPKKKAAKAKKPPKKASTG